MAQARFQKQNKHANEADKQSLHSDNQERAILFFSLAFGGNTMLKFMLSLGDIPCDVDKHIPLKICRSKWWKIDPHRINSGTFQ